MESVAKAPAIPKPTDRMMEALATLAALLDRTISEVKVLDGDFQKRIADAVKKKDESVRAEASQMVEAARSEVHQELTTRFQSELQTALDSLRADFQAERDRWSSESGVERDRLNKELQHIGSTASELQVEKTRLSAELQRVKDEFGSEIGRLRAAADAASAAAAAAAKAPAVPVATDEIERTRKRLAEVIALIDDPATELSVVIRKNVEKLELEAYLRGLRYTTDNK